MLLRANWKGASPSGDSSEQYVWGAMKLHIPFNLFFPFIGRNLKGKKLPWLKMFIAMLIMAYQSLEQPNA